MPIHSFVCKNCGANFDLLVNITSDTGKPKCEKCQSEKITRTFSAFSVGSSTHTECDSTSCDIAQNAGGCCPGCKMK